MSASPRKTQTKKAVATKVAKDATKRTKVGAGSIGRSSDGVTVKRKRPHRIADEKAPAVAAESPVEDASGRVSSGLDLSANDKRTLQSAGLGGVTKGESVPVMRSPHVMAAELFRAANPARKRLTIKEGAPPPLQGTAGELLPLSAEWGDILKRLLNERDFDPRAIIDKPLRHDLIGILAHMPFGLRAQAAARFHKGYRVFAKVPCRSTSLDSASHSINRVTVGAVRPISCPEPAGAGCEFELAWAAGDFWEYEFDILDEIDEMIGSKLNSELYQLKGFIGKARRRLEDRLALQAPADRGDESLTALATLLEDMDGMDDADFLPIALAFRAGATYSQKVQFSSDGRLYDEWVGDTFEGWQSIIEHALFRHGLDVDRKTLLKKLGCLNADEFSKDSNKPLVFDSPYTPPASGVSFNKSFGKALSQAKQYVTIRQGRPGGSAIDLVVASLNEKRKRNSRYQNRTATTKKAKTELSDRKKAERVQQAAAAKADMESIQKKDQEKATQELTRRVLEASKSSAK